MSLTLIQAQDISQFSRDVAVNSDDPPSPTGAYRIQGVYDGAANPGGLVYLHSLDRYLALGRGTSPGTPGAKTVAFYKIDPFFLATNPPESGFLHVHASTGPEAIILGDYDPSTGMQRVFSHQAGTEVLLELNPLTMSLAGSSAFTGPNGDFDISMSDIASSSEGGWAAILLDPFRIILFLGMTDGIPGETINQGSNIYPDGLALLVVTGTLNGISYNRVFGWVDIRTRRLVGILGSDPDGGLSAGTFASFPATVDSTPPLGSNYEGPIGGDQFDWVFNAFYPDSDSTATQPKGFLFASSFREIPVIGSSSPGDVQRIYLRFTDFNPFGVVAASGQPSRVHGRIEMTTRMVPIINPMFDLAGVTEVVNPSANQPAWDPIRGRFVLILNSAVVANPPVTANGDCAVGFYSQAPAIAFVAAPAPRSVPRTNAITEFQTAVSGDIGEPIAGATIGWTLSRRSTLNETLTISGGIGTTSTVANPPIDDEVPSVAEGTLRIFADGIELQETTDFTVVLSTGVITWVTDQQGASIVTASYEHRQTSASPSFGTLLSSQSQTDENGQAITRVRYPDNDAIVGELDGIDADPI